jgi:L-glyceraldehyde 3-phosphate reductase
MILKSLGTPCLIHQPNYNMFDRWIEGELVHVLGEYGIGCIAFSPLAQGLLTNKYFTGIPDGSRASKKHGFLQPKHVSDVKVAKAMKLDLLAKNRGQTLAQMAVSWILRLPEVTSALIGASKPEQILEIVSVAQNLIFSESELNEIDMILA